MGGGSYDRDVYSSYSSGSSTSWGTTKSYSTESSKVMSRSRPTNDMTPSVKGNLICEHENPIVIAFDVTGSMGEAPRIMYDKFPMFWGELVKKNYLPDPDRKSVV